MHTNQPKISSHIGTSNLNLIHFFKNLISTPNTSKEGDQESRSAHLFTLSQVDTNDVIDRAIRGPKPVARQGRRGGRRGPEEIRDEDNPEKDNDQEEEDVLPRRVLPSEPCHGSEEKP